MNNLMKDCLIKQENLDNGQYLQSFIQEAYRVNLLTNTELEHFQLQSIQLLAEQTERYTKGESSSVKVETAQNILQSVYYTIGIYLKALPNPDICLAELKSRPLSELYAQGIQINERQTQKAKRLFRAVSGNSIETENIAYNDTVKKGLAVFFNAYDMHFDAHSSHANIDYPLSNDKMDLAGIEYFYHYLETLFYENQFCKKFDSAEIHLVLRGYDENYKDLLLNIFEHVLRNALGRVLIDKPALKMNIEPADRNTLQTNLEKLTENELGSVLLNAVKALCHELDITNAFLQNHITQATESFVPELKKALTLHNLEPFFITFKKERVPMRFEDGKKMNNALFAQTAQKIRGCQSAEEKAMIIREKVHSLIDLTELLGCGYIYGDEFPVLFESMDDRELALLLKKLPSYGLNAGFSLTGNEKEWEIEFTRFLTGLEPARRNCIREFAEKIRLDDWSS